MDQPVSEEKSGLLRSVSAIGCITVVSRVTGFVRDMLIASCAGANALTDAFLVAIKLANVLRRLFAEGAFSASFLPVFSRVLVQNGQEKAQAFASQLLTFLVLSLSTLSLFVIWKYEGVIRVLAPGFPVGGETFKTAVFLGRICFPYLIATSVMALFCGILNTLDRFAIPAATQILLNVFFILMLCIGIIGQLPIADIVVMMVVAMLVAGIVQVGLVWGVVEHLKVRVRLVRPRLSPELREVGRKMIPGILGAGVWQINLLIDTQACSFLSVGSVSYVYFADRINQLPLSVLGIALSTALLPTLSKLIHAGRHAQATAELNRGINWASCLTIPATTTILMIPHVLTALVYERGNFTPHQVTLVAEALRAFGYGLPAYVGTKILASSFFAQGDTRSPVRVGIIAVFVNIALILLFAPRLAHVGVALATALSSWVNVGILFLLLLRKSPLTIIAETKKCCLKQLLAALAMGGEMAAFNILWGQDFSASNGKDRLLMFLALIVVALGTYVLLTVLLKALPKSERT
ncbi:MAG: murein biosynthesis integral membrane protein MurJ [Holosporales bacterium]|nr:murein biosynthesis integral membrane protein MurJ [Holosporales bacterium]